MTARPSFESSVCWIAEFSTAWAGEGAVSWISARISAAACAWLSTFAAHAGMRWPASAMFSSSTFTVGSPR
ncbi:hypothetical protein [Clavibacter michiganensis]|uniref:hypothetical protein n=1 Tax=Clavibacter michiganensis TaxID=28447 RepID=UPI001559002F|nr:hypothetical protein [Clavibacter michiganensis]